MQKLQERSNRTVDSSTYKADFRALLESHLHLFQSESKNIETPALKDLTRFRGDFYSLLFEMGVREELHYITMRLNGLADPGDFTHTQTNILIADEDLFQRLLQQYKLRK